MIFAFGDFELDTLAWRLRRDGEEVAVQRKAFDVLRYLLEHRDRPVSREELLEQVWNGDVVTPAVLTVAISKARQAIGQKQDDEGPIATEHGRGYRFSGEARVRGAQEPARASVAAQSTGAADRSPFVGRVELLGALEHALRAAEERRAGSLCLLVGEPGVGKTRTAEELARRAAERGIGAWWGRGHESEGMPAFWPWTQILRRAVEEVPRARWRELGPSVAELAKLVPAFGEARAQPATAEVRTEAAHFRMFDAVTRALALASKERPRLVVLDDLHWSDGPSIELLGYMLAEIIDTPLLLVGTLRDSELATDHPIRSAIDRLVRNTNCRRYELARLSAEDVDRYTTELFGRQAPALSRAVYDRCEGNAFLMTEVLRPLSSRGAGASERDLEVPEPALDLVRRRVRALGGRAARVLGAAAVLGRSFDLARLAAVMESEPGELLEALEAALAVRLVAPVGEGTVRFSFGHGLFRQTLYEDLPLAERARLHLRTAEVLEAARGSGADIAAQELAHHFTACLPDGPAEKALTWARQAGDAAMQVFAWEEAVRQYERASEALEFVSEATAGVRAELLLARGEALRLAGRLEHAQETFSRALDLARRAEEPRPLALAAIGLRSCQPMRAVPDPRVIGALTEALMVLPDAEAALRARVLSRLAGQRPMETRRLMSQRAAELADGIDDPTTLYDVLAARLHATQGPDAFDDRLELAEQIVALAEAHAQPYWKWEALLARYDAALRRCDVVGAGAALDACAALADTLHHPLLVLEVQRLRLQRQLCRGELDGIGDAIVRLCAVAERLRSPFAQFNFFVQSASYFRDLGVLAAPAETAEVFISRFPWVEHNARAQIALHALDAGRIDEARASYEYFAKERFDGVHCGEDWLFVLAMLSPVAARLAPEEDVALLYERIAPYRAQNVMSSAFLEHGSAEHYLGLLAQRLEREGAARAHFEAALETNQRTGQSAALARSEIAYGDLLLAPAGDPERARSLYSAALARARERGMRGLEREAEARLASR